MPHQKSILVDAKNRRVRKLLQRVTFSSNSIDERLLQEVLFESPGTLPLDAFGSNFAPAACIGREILKTDLLYLSTDGFITIVETKLWNNPEARRTAVAQILDYAKKLSQWNYEQLESSVQKKLAFEQSLYDWLCQHGETSEYMPKESVFIDSVQRNLRNGHFLLMIVGDGIREGVQDLTESLNQAPQLGFTFGLVEIACYRWDQNNLLLSPSIVARTKEIERAVVRIEMKETARDEVIAEVITNHGDVTTTPSHQSFMEILAEQTNPTMADQLNAFCHELESKAERVEVIFRNSLILKCYYTEGGKDKSHTLFRVTKAGEVAFAGKVRWRTGSNKLKRVIETLWDGVSALFPEVKPQRKDDGGVDIPSCPLRNVLEKREQLQRVIEEYTNLLNTEIQ